MRFDGVGSRVGGASSVPHVGHGLLRICITYNEVTHQTSSDLRRSRFAGARSVGAGAKPNENVSNMALIKIIIYTRTGSWTCRDDGDGQGKF